MFQQQDDFVIPLHDDDLIAKGFGQEDYTPEELKEKIKDFATVLAQGQDSAKELGGFFDIFFCCIRQQEELNIRVLTLAWEVLIQCQAKHLRELSDVYLPEVVETGQHEWDDERIYHLNALQMNLYLLSRLVELFHSLVRKAAGEEIILDAKKRGGKKKASAISNNPLKNWDWDGAKLNFLSVVKDTFSLKVSGANVYCLRYLWNPHIIENSFVDMIINACGKLLETEDNILLKDMIQSAFPLFGVMLSTCDCDSTLTGRLTQVIQHLDCDKGVGLLAEGIRLMTEGKKGPWDTFFAHLMRDLGDADSEDMAKEGKTAKANGNFLVSVAQVCPALALPHISFIMAHMDGESYLMRNSVLTVLVELVLGLLGGEHRTKEERLRRDRLLEKVEEHVMDVNAFTRCKCIQLWTRLFEEDGVPLSTLHNVFPAIAGRLQDKASTVRKAAMHFVTTVLRKNPYRDKLSLEELTQLRNDAKKAVDDFTKDDWERLADIGRNKWEEIEMRVRESVEKRYAERRGEETGDSGAQDGEGDGDPDGEPDMDSLDSANLKVLVQRLDTNEWMTMLHGLLEAGAFEEAQDYLHRFFQSVGSTNELFTNWTEEKLRNPEEGKDLVLTAFQELFVHVSQQEEGWKEKEELGNEADEEYRRKTELRKLKRTLYYLEDTIKFAEDLQAIVPKVCNLFKSNTNTDVLEAIDFVVTCAEFKVPGSRLAVRRMCNLIWRKDSVIKENVVKAYRRLFLDVDGTGGSKKTVNHSIAHSLIETCFEANMSENASLEEVIGEMMKQGLLKKEVLSVFWEYFRMSVEGGCTQEESQAALKLIAMSSKAEKTLISANLDVLVEYGLGERAEKDFRFAKDVCYTIQMLGVKVDLKNEESIRKDPFRLQPDHILFQRLTQVLLKGSSRFEDIEWSAFMEQAMNVIFFLSEHPDVIAAQLVTDLAKKMDEDIDALKDEGNTEELERARTGYLVRLLSLGGHVALRVLIHLDVAYCGELKRRNYLTELLNSPSRKKKSLGPGTPKSTSDSAPGTPQSGRDPCEEELGLAGAAAEDLEQELAIKVCDEEVLSERSVLGRLRPLVQEICAPEKWHCFSAPVLTAASLALAKMMLVSHDFCSESLSMFFTMMKKCPISSVRANLMIAAGDLSSRFPNDIEQWSSYLYNMLGDPDQCVRQNCLLVLTHLILNDMIKPKGKVADIALITLDPMREMSGLAKRFFTEMSQKGDAVYKLLPDIISQLTEPGENRPTEQVKSVLKFLLHLLSKDKQCENLVEKICQRFQTVNSVAQWQYLSYCLAQLPPYSEKSLKKLQDNMDKLADKLGDKEVYDNFLSILAASKKAAKGDTRGLLEDLEGQLAELHNEKFEDEEAAERAKAAIRRKSQEKKKKFLAPTRTPSRRTKPKRTLKVPQEDEEENISDQ